MSIGCVGKLGPLFGLLRHYLFLKVQMSRTSSARGSAYLLERENEWCYSVEYPWIRKSNTIGKSGIIDL